MDISLRDLIQTISDAGTLGLMAVIIYGAAKEWWVWGWLYKELRQERNYWRDIALRATDLAAKVADQQGPPS